MFRRSIPMAACLAALAACSFDTAGSLRERDGSVSEPDDASTPDARPDATPVACTGDDDCAAPASACQLPGTCDQSTNLCVFPDKDCTGETDECNIGTCNPASGECEKLPAFNGDPCGAVTTCEAFSECGSANEDDVCDETGTRSRECTDFACSVGACVGTARTEAEDCMLDTDGDPCGAETECGAFGACEFATVCAESGTQSRDCVAFACADASCEGTPFTDTRSCMRDTTTDGVTCGDTTCTFTTACSGFSSTCDETGTRNRRCIERTCEDEACMENAVDTTVACPRDTDGDPCGRIDEQICTGSGSCPGPCMGVCQSTCINVSCDDGTCPSSTPGTCS